VVTELVPPAARLAVVKVSSVVPELVVKFRALKVCVPPEMTGVAPAIIGAPEPVTVVV